MTSVGVDLGLIFQTKLTQPTEPQLIYSIIFFNCLSDDLVQYIYIDLFKFQTILDTFTTVQFIIIPLCQVTCKICSLGKTLLGLYLKYSEWKDRCAIYTRMCS